jgi:alpha-L-fucosidase 2
MYIVFLIPMLFAFSHAEKNNFHIYLAFGQSNMEGINWKDSTAVYSDILPEIYKENVDPRFQVMAAVSGQRTKGKWYKAVPPLARDNLGLSPADYFGRTLVAGIDDQNVKIGVIVVAIGGTTIEGFEKGSGANAYFKRQSKWKRQIAALYNNNPYQRIVELAKEAQKTGVIKGIIMHQGESGATSDNWAQKVKGIYDNLLSDLGLPANSIPFLAGQPYGADNNLNNAGTISALCNTFNANIAGDKSKKVCHVISSSGCESGGDNLHFSYEGYKTLGERYGKKMLEILY